jgi:signal transduction histidine kinase
VALAASWALAAPWLSALEPEQLSVSARLAMVLAAVAVGAIARRVLGNAPPGPATGFRLAVVVAVSGALVGAGAAALLGQDLADASRAALLFSNVGTATVVALAVAPLAAMSRRRAAHTADPLPLHVLVPAPPAALTLAAWALISGHVLGQRQADAERNALADARNLAALVVERALVAGELDLRAPGLAPRDGVLVALDRAGAVVAGVGTAVPSGSHLPLEANAQARCHIGQRALLCSVRTLPDGARVLAAVPAQEVSGRAILALLVLGVGVTLGAYLLGRISATSAAGEMRRIAHVIEGLTPPHGLDRPITARSHDELGDLAAALARLRHTLAPTLQDYARAVEEAERADQARTQFLQVISAALRSPLDQIVASAEALLAPDAEKLAPEQSEDVRIVLASSRHLIDLIDEVLDISAIATGRVALKLADVDVGRIAADVAKAQRPLVQQKGVEIRIDVEEPSPRARADERRVRQVLTNIVSNAVKFTQAGSVSLEARTIDATGGGREIEVRVVDTGPGIPPDQLPRLFTEFVQLGSLKQRAHGTGLGLAICKRLVEAHGGKVAAESQVGVGSTFRVLLPVDGPAAAAS